jgi:uncharacterized protein (TIGR02284 family)
MAWQSERDILNGLIQICRDGARGFRLAADHVSTPELKGLLNATATQRETFAAELVPLARVLGGETDAPGTKAGALHRRWMAIRDAMSNYDEEAIVAEAVRGEAVAARTYAEAILGILPPMAREVIESQYRQLLDSQRQLEAWHLPTTTLL